MATLQGIFAAVVLFASEITVAAPMKKIRLLLSVGGAVLFLVGLAVAARLLPSILGDEPPRDGG